MIRTACQFWLSQKVAHFRINMVTMQCRLLILIELRCLCEIEVVFIFTASHFEVVHFPATDYLDLVILLDESGEHL